MINIITQQKLSTFKVQTLLLSMNSTCKCEHKPRLNLCGLDICTHIGCLPKFTLESTVYVCINIHNCIYITYIFEHIERLPKQIRTQRYTQTWN